MIAKKIKDGKNIMDENIISFDRDSIIEFIKKNTEINSLYSIQEELLEALMQIIPLLNHYEEENQKLNFKLAVGINTTIENLDGRFHILQEYIYDASDIKEIRTSKIRNMLKKVAIFCSQDADVFIVQNENVIECGIYFTDLEKTGSSEITLLNANFVVFQGVLKSKVLAMGKQGNKLLCFDLDINDKYTSILNQDIKNDLKVTVCRTWNGIFEKVKKTVHGTICLIVDKSWDPTKDHNYTNLIHELNISLSRDDNINADKFQDFDNKIGMFLSMLNFDGITVIDIDENIRAYNLFCKIKTSSIESDEGGARHRAYNYLKNLLPEERESYIAVYFQSQEGTVKFYDFSEPLQEKNSFDSLIMNGGTNNPFYKLVKSCVEKKKLFDTSQQMNNDLFDFKYYKDINQLTDLLFYAHNGIDNFYNEPEPAQKLLEQLSDPKYIEVAKKYPFLTTKIVNVVMQCILGNSYGYSRAAQDSLHSILALFDITCWTSYFENKDYVDSNLLWILSNEKLLKRWNAEINEIFNKFPQLSNLYNQSYNAESFRFMYRALVKITSNE